MSTNPPELEEKSHHLLANPRIVSELQCNAMKRNFELLLQETNQDTHHPLNRHDFTMVFNTILPDTDRTEIEKLFDFMDGDGENNKIKRNTKTVSFHALLYNPHNFHKLLHSMGCQREQNDNCDSYNTTVQTKQKDNRLMIRSKMVPLSEATELTPQVSFNQTYDVYHVAAAPDATAPNQLYRRESMQSNTSYTTNKTMKNVNGNNYTEYIKYQKEQIMELKHAINESNRYEIRCNELQLILDTKHQMIHNLKEEIKQLHLDKKERMLEISTIRAQYNELCLDLNEYRRYHEAEHESNQRMEQHVQHLTDEQVVRSKKSERLKTEKQKLNQLNQQFTQINERLRVELENERTKIQKLKDDLCSKDEEVRSVTLNLLSRDQTIQALQNENDDLTQLNYTLLNPPNSVRFDTCDGETVHMDWGRHGSRESFFASPVPPVPPVPPENLEFDMFQDFDVPVTLKGQNSIVSATTDPYVYSNRYMTPRHKVNPWSPREAKGPARKKDMEDEKTCEQTDWNTVVLLNRIRELEQEVERYKNSSLYQGTISIATQTKGRGFWESVLEKIACVPNMFDDDIS